MYVLHHTFKFSKNHRLENFFVKTIPTHTKQKGVWSKFKVLINFSSSYTLMNMFIEQRACATFLQNILVTFNMMFYERSSNLTVLL